MASNEPPCYILDIPTETRYRLWQNLIPAGPVSRRAGRKKNDYAMTSPLLRVNSTINADVKALLFATKKRQLEIGIQEDGSCVGASFYQHHYFASTTEDGATDVVNLRPGSYSQFKFVEMSVWVHDRCQVMASNCDRDVLLPTMENLIRALLAVDSKGDVGPEAKGTRLSIRSSIITSLSGLEHALRKAALIFRCCRWFPMKCVVIEWRYQMLIIKKGQEDKKEDSETASLDENDKEGVYYRVVWTDPDDLTFNALHGVARVLDEEHLVSAMIKRLLPRSTESAAVSEELQTEIAALWRMFMDFTELLAFLEPLPVIQVCIRLRGRDPDDEVQDVLDAARCALFKRDRDDLRCLLQDVLELVHAFCGLHPEQNMEAIKILIERYADKNTNVSGSSSLEEAREGSADDDDDWDYKNDEMNHGDDNGRGSDNAKDDSGFEEDDHITLLNTSNDEDDDDDDYDCDGSDHNYNDAASLQWPDWKAAPVIRHSLDTIVDEVWYTSKVGGRLRYWLMTPERLADRERCRSREAAA